MKSHTSFLQHRRAGMSILKFVFGACLWIAVFVASWFVLKRGSDKESLPAETSAAVASPADGADASEDAPEDIQAATDSEGSVQVRFPARPLPDFEFDEVMGGKLGLKDLKGKRWVASMVFTRCTLSCPTISAAVMRLHDRIARTAPDIVFVTFTVDPKHDTLDVLKQYSEIYTKGDHSRWKFVTGDQQKIYDLVVNGFGLYVRENDPQSRLPGIEVAHSNRIVLINEDGIPVATFLATKESEMVRLRRILEGRDEFPKPLPPGVTTATDGGLRPIEMQAVPKDTKQDDDGAGDESAGDEQPRDEEPGDAGASLDDSSAAGTLNETGANSSLALRMYLSRYSIAGTFTEADATSSQPPLSTESEEPGTIEPSAPPHANVAGEDNTSPPSMSAEKHNAQVEAALPEWARRLPAWNAVLNSAAAILLLSGLIAVKNGKTNVHRNLMISAFVTSIVFLGCYLVYHWALGRYTGEHGKRFTGEGVWAVVYQLILWPHIVLAAAVPVLAVQVLRHAFAKRWEQHKALARITFPIWMFVSVTGVVIYGMLYHWPQS